MRVQLVVGVGRSRIGPVRVAAHLPHRRRGGLDVRVNACRHGCMHGRPERGALVRLDHVERPAQNVRVDLHHEGILEQPAGDGELAHRHVVALESCR